MSLKDKELLCDYYFLSDVSYSLNEKEQFKILLIKIFMINESLSHLENRKFER